MVANTGAVTVTAQISPDGVIRREFGITLYTDRADAVETNLVAAQRIRDVRVYASSTAVAKDNPGTNLKKAAEVYFQQVPYPRNLIVGTHIETAQPSFIFGTTLGSISDIEDLGDSFALTIDGKAITADFDGLTTYDAIASAIADGINAHADYSGVAATAVDNKLVIQGTADINFGTGFAADTSALLGLTGTGVIVLAPQAAETLTAALDRIQTANCDMYWISLNPVSSVDETDALDFANWVASRKYGTILDLVTEGGVLTTDESTSIGAQLFALQQENVAAIYNGDAIDFKAISFMARFASFDPDGVDTIITGKFKTLPGTTANTLSQTQKDELDRKRINFYVPVGAGFDTAEGKSFGTWIDVRYFVDWMKNALEVDTYQVLKDRGRVPQTNPGQGAIMDAANGVLEQAVSNGGLAPNTVSAALRASIIAATRNQEFDGFLSTGYLAYAESFAFQSQANRAARKGQPVKIWAKGSGAIHFADIEIEFEN